LERIARRCLELVEVAPPKKGICTSRSFGKGVKAFDEVQEVTATYSKKHARTLRQQKRCASLLTLFVTTNRFSENGRQYANSKSICLPVVPNQTIAC
jgi:DNA polymerase V